MHEPSPSVLGSTSGLGRSSTAREFLCDRENETARIEAFSDGVFAIAMTLLVIELKVPSHDLVATTGLAWALYSQWPSYVAFLTSFATILVIWAHHHWIFVLIRKSDHPLLYWNGLLLLFVTFVPFPTALLADYLNDPQARVAANLYTGTFLAISLAFDALWLHARKSLLATHPTNAKQEEASQMTALYRVATAFYLVTFLVSFVSEGLSVVLSLALAILFAMRGWPLRRIPR